MLRFQSPLHKSVGTRAQISEPAPKTDRDPDSDVGIRSKRRPGSRLRLWTPLQNTVGIRAEIWSPLQKTVGICAQMQEPAPNIGRHPGSDSGARSKIRSGSKFKHGITFQISAGFGIQILECSPNLGRDLVQFWDWNPDFDLIRCSNVGQPSSNRSKS